MVPRDSSSFVFFKSELSTEQRCNLPSAVLTHDGAWTGRARSARALSFASPAPRAAAAAPPARAVTPGAADTELSTAEDKVAIDDDASLESLAGSDFTTSSEEEKEYHGEGDTDLNLQPGAAALPPPTPRRGTPPSGKCAKEVVDGRKPT